MDSFKNSYKFLQILTYSYIFLQNLTSSSFHMCTYLAYVQHAMDVQLASIIWQVRKLQGPKFFVMELE